MERDNNKIKNLKLLKKKQIKLKVQERKENLQSVDLNFFRKNNEIVDNVFYNSIIKTPEKTKKIKKKYKIGINKRDRKKSFLESDKKNSFKDFSNNKNENNTKKKHFDFNFKNKNVAAFSEIKKKKNNLNLNSNHKNFDIKTIESLRKFSNSNDSKKSDDKIKNISSIFSTPIQNSNLKKKKNKIKKIKKIK